MTDNQNAREREINIMMGEYESQIWKAKIKADRQRDLTIQDVKGIKEVLNDMTEKVGMESLWTHHYIKELQGMVNRLLSDLKENE